MAYSAVTATAVILMIAWTSIVVARRRAFTAGAETVHCSFQAREGFLGAGWQQGVARKGEHAVEWRRWNAFQPGPHREVATPVTIKGTRPAAWREAWFLNRRCVVVILDTPAGVCLGVRRGDLKTLEKWLTA